MSLGTKHVLSAAVTLASARDDGRVDLDCTLRHFRSFGGDSTPDSEATQELTRRIAVELGADDGASPAAVADVLRAGYAHSTNDAQHAAYLGAARRVGNARHNEPATVTAEQDSRARVHRRGQWCVQSVASEIYALAGARYAQQRPAAAASCVPAPIVLLGCGGGLHTQFRVRGQRTTATAWTNACRLARRGHCCVLVDEFNTSSVSELAMLGVMCVCMCSCV